MDVLPLPKLTASRSHYQHGDRCQFECDYSSPRGKQWFSVTSMDGEDHRKSTRLMFKRNMENIFFSSTLWVPINRRQTGLPMLPMRSSWMQAMLRGLLRHIVSS